MAEAEQICRQILSIEPHDADALHLLGTIAHQVGKHGIAVEYITQAITINARVANFHNSIGEAYRALGRWEEALTSYRQALALKPDFAEARNNLGMLLQAKGQLEESIVEALARTKLSIAQCRHGLFLFNSNDLVGGCLLTYGEWAEPEVQLLLSLIRQDDIVIDVGANIGSISVPIAKKLGETGRLFCFEPQYHMFQYLCANAALNGLSNVRAINAAVGDVDCFIEIPQADYSKPGNFSALSLLDAPRAASEEVNTVPCWRLDHYLSRIKSCRLLKVDVEGMEYAVIAGAAELIKRCRPFLYCEANREDQFDRMSSLIRGQNYDIYWHGFSGYNPENYRRSKENFLGTLGDMNILGIPKEMNVSVQGLHPALRFEEAYRLFPGVLPR